MNISGVNFTGGFIVSPAVDNQFNYVTALLHGDGASAGQNNTFLDSSTNNFAITRTGSTTQGSYAPFGTLWSNFLNTGDKLTASASSAFDLSGSTWTIEFWMYSLATPTSGNQCRMLMAGSNGDAAGWDISYDNTGYLGFFRPYGGSPVGIATPASTIVLNNWYHVAVVCNAGSARIYINGTQAAGPVTISLPTSASQALRIGYDDIGTVNFQYNGYLSNLRIVKGTAVYTSNFTPSTSPLTAITNTSLLTCQSNRFIDNSTNNLTITPTGTPSVQVYSPFGTTTQYNPTVIGGSGYFNGSTDYLSVPNNSSLQFGTNNFTIEFWVNFISVASGQQVINGYQAIPNINYAIYTNSSGTLNYFFSSDGSNWNIASGVSIGSITVGQWYHVALVRNGSVFTPYLNGVAGTTTTSSATIFPNSSPTYIAAAVNGSGVGSNFLNGSVSNLRIVNGTAVYTTAFTPPTIPVTAITNTALLLNFTNGQIYDNGMMNNLVTVGTAQISTSVVKYGTGSIFINGSGNYLTMPSSPNLGFGTGDFTIEGWLYLVSTSSYSTIITNRTSATDNTAGRWSVAVRNSAFEFFSGGSQIVSSGTVSTSTWTHFAASRASGSLRLFLNGTQVGSTTSFTTSLSTLAASIGANGAGTEPLTGYIDELRITNGFARYTSNFTAPTSQFPSTGPIPIYTPTVEYLVVAGGAAGGGRHGGGGGAGGVLSGTSLPITIGTIYPITVGAGGAATTEVIGNNGSNSAIGTSNSYSFNGSSQYLTVAANTALDFGTGDFTVECWVYPTSIANNFPTFLGSITGWSAGASGHRYNNTGQANKFSFHLNGAGDPFMSSSGTFSFNIWYHYALTRSGNTWNMYVNGVLQSTQTSAIAYNPSLGGLRSGWSTWDGAGGYFAGNISNLRLVKGVTVYTGAFTPPTSPLTATQSAGTNISAITGVQTSLLTLQNSNLIDNSTYAFAITNTGSVLSYVTPFSLISSIGGGGGGVYTAMTANTGGSGGGAGSNSGSPTGAAGTAGQGNAGGGNTYNATNDTRPTGGGGGAGAAGTSGTSTVQSNGGVGVVSSITGTSLYWGGGGGGSMWTDSGPATPGAGNGGLGGGGGGGSQSHISPASAAGTGGGSALNSGSPGTQGSGGSTTSNGGNGGANTGGGGGGCSQYYSGYSQYGVSGAGGSGVVIVRYPSSFNLASSTTGSPTVATTGGYNIYTWTSSGSITF